MNLKDSQGNALISPEDLNKLHEGLKVLTPLRTKYYKLGKTISSSQIPEGLKSQFFSLGRELEKLLILWGKFGEI